ncbi:MAG: agmatinase [Pseudomonadota bacterium]|nr:agmatinase [Pseudomonadota bacterium]
MNFGALEPEWAAYDSALFVVIPVPYDLTSTYQPGARLGPGAILAASANMELYDDELGKSVYRQGIHTTPPLEVDARGPEFMASAVRRSVAPVLADRKIPVLLGGDHSVTLGAIQAVKAAFPDLQTLQLDAHADLRDAYQGTPYSHACIARRIQELCPLVQAGIRSMSEEEALFLRDGAVKSFSADFICQDPAWAETICEGLHGDVYVTIDIDVLDPSVMPATGTPEPGGISWRQLLMLMRLLAKRCRIRGFDVVELAPIPGQVAPDFLAAKLIYRIMGYISG